MTVEYYLLKEYKLDELSTATVTIENTTLNDLSTCEQRDIDNFTYHKLYGKSLFTYNDRIFMGNIKNIFYQGPPLDAILNYPDSPYVNELELLYCVGIEYDIITSSRETLSVFAGWLVFMAYNEAKTHMYFRIGDVSDGNNSYWGYLDARSINARILIKYNNVIRLASIVRLASNQILNFAVSPTIQLSVKFSDLDLYTIITGKTSYWDYNRVQATELNNPFYFPALNSYRIGLGKILGMSTNAIALSQGQFGQFPIFCFTTDGIWTMNIGTSETLINTISPLSRDVCNNPASITPIDGRTAFTTAKGLFIISGTQVIEISDLAEGSQTSKISGNINHEGITNNPNLYKIKDYICLIPFLTYISGAKIAWDNEYKELIVSNSLYKYSWIYSLKYKTWFKISESWDCFITDFPRTYGYKSDNGNYYRYNINDEEFLGPLPVYIETRPIKLSAGSFKKISRLLVHGSLSDLDSPFSAHLFGSADKIHWYLMNNGRHFVEDAPVLIGRSTFSCKYFILVLGGKVDEFFHLTHVDVDFEPRYGNKLR